jgi:hypothetical protein
MLKVVVKTQEHKRKSTEYCVVITDREDVESYQPGSLYFVVCPYQTGKEHADLIAEMVRAWLAATTGHAEQKLRAVKDL